jgi:hypothetical protein
MMRALARRWSHRVGRGFPYKKEGAGMIPDLTYGNV